MSLVDRYAVLGNPVAHSQSPFIHAAFAAQTGQALEYGRLLCPTDGFDACVRGFAAEGGSGCNVTVPFKFDAARLAMQITPRAALAEAANVLRFDAEGGWWADNSDGIGLRRDIEVNVRQPLGGLRVLLVGAGGAAAGALGPLLEGCPAQVRVLNRTLSRAQKLVDRHASLAGRHDVALQAGALDVVTGQFDLVINASASSLQGAPVPVPPSVLAPGALAVDLMYGAAAAPFLGWAEAAGARARDGLGMLVEQAAEAFFAWRGVRPLTAPVLHALRERLADKGP
jgi:shikimate dehydrogenase